jgi:hypothetical protein
MEIIIPEFAPLPVVDENKGRDIMEGLLLSQYQNSPILKSYIKAFTDEMDLLLSEIEKVYLGRFIEFAEGRQLDIIGTILGESRAVNLPIQFFGFKDENGYIPPGIPDPAFADEANPTNGGVFRSEGQGDTGTAELSDTLFRRLLIAKAFLSTRDEISADNVYYAVSLLLNKTPRVLRLVTNAPRQVTLEMDSQDATLFDESFVEYFGKYLAPLGTSFSVTRV